MQTKGQANHQAFHPQGSTKILPRVTCIIMRSRVNRLVGFKVVCKVIFKVVLGELTLLREVRGDSRLGSPPVRPGALILPGGRQERNRK